MPPVRIDSTTAVTSSRVIRPPPPVPTICAAVRPCSRRRRRTAGVMRASGSPWLVAGGAAVAAGRVAVAAGAWAGAAGGGARPRRGLRRGAARRSWPPRGSSRRSRPGRRRGAAAAAGAAAEAGSEVTTGPVAAASVAPSSAVSMIAISALFGTVAPSSARISFRTPSNGDGTSALTLSVMTSSSGSYLATWSPGCLSHFPIVPSATLSPSWGIVTFATFVAPSIAGRQDPLHSVAHPATVRQHRRATAPHLPAQPSRATTRGASWRGSAGRRPVVIGRERRRGRTMAARGRAARRRGGHGRVGRRGLRDAGGRSRPWRGRASTPWSWASCRATPCRGCTSRSG